MTPPRSRVCVLASGGGSNLGALVEHGDRLGETRSAEVALVVSNRTSAGALGRAAARGIETAVIGSSAGERDLLDLLVSRHIDLVVLAGYLRLIPAGVTGAYRGRLINVHPALLPAFGGAGMFGHRVHQAVLDAGARVTGATVHFVDEHYDRGPIIAQWPVPVVSGDTAETLAARVLRAEHALLPRVVEAVAAGHVHLTKEGTVAGLPQGHLGLDAGFELESHSTDPGPAIDAMFFGTKRAGT